MKKIKLILCGLAIMFTSQIFCQNQIQVINFKVPDPVVSEQNLKNFSYFMNLAREEFIKKDFDKTFYYLKHAEKDGWYSAEFWYYMGISVYYRDNKRAAKRYLKRGFYKYGCADCSVAYEQLFGKKLKF